jgi:PIN domain nuclease of toxin-antitoxin system
LRLGNANKAAAWQAKLSLPLSILIENQKTTNDIQVLSVELEHVLALEKSPSHHKDPFDRLLIAQANVEDFVVVSNDPIFKKYPVKVVW